jgi:DNA-binding MurR/RpiR family transcriptional regulator
MLVYIKDEGVIVIENKSVLENIMENYDSMFAAEKKVADYILSNPECAVSTNVSELAELSGASDATVIRMCKRIGYEGYYQMKIKLSHDLGKDRMVQLEKGNKQPENLNDVFQVIASNLLYTAERQDMELILKCVSMIEQSKTVHIIATGNTIPLAMDFSFRLGKLGVRTMSSVINEYFLTNISLASEDDLVIGISHSGSSRHVLQALELAKERNIKSIVITETARSPIARVADYLICTTARNPIFDDYDYGLTSPLYLMAVIDAILYFVAKREEQKESIDRVELILSELKL